VGGGGFAGGQAEGSKLWAAIEAPPRRIVDFWLGHGVVYAINPNSLDRARDRFPRPGRARVIPSTRGVLALFLRSDHASLRPRAAELGGGQDSMGLTRDYRRQVHLQTRLLNQLTPR